MNPGLVGFFALLVTSVAVVTFLYALLRPSLKHLLRQTLALPSAVSFYLRSFLLVLLLSGLSAALAISFDMKPGVHFMEYVWKEAEGLASIFEKILLLFALFLVLVTVLIATLKIKNDE